MLRPRWIWLDTGDTPLSGTYWTTPPPSSLSPKSKRRRIPPVDQSSTNKMRGTGNNVPPRCLIFLTCRGNKWREGIRQGTGKSSNRRRKMGGRECGRGIAQNRESHGTILLETSQANISRMIDKVHIIDRFKLLVLFFEIPWSDLPSGDLILCKTLQ